MDRAMTSVLPQDVMLLICQELGARREFTALYHCSFLSHRIASIALEQLYGILEVMDPFIEDKLQAARLWRSIILSSFGVTFYPYCAYLRVLSLGSLIECLTDIRSDRSVCGFFLAEDLIVPGCDYKMCNIHEYTRICGDSIVKHIQMLADKNGTSVALTHLESNTVALSRGTLTNWISRLGTLTSLQLEDGSILGEDIGKAIAKCCPKFTELICFHYTSETAAQDMAAFFRALRPNSLRRFEVHSVNNFNNATIAALNTHAKSLRVLNLRCLPILSHVGPHSLYQCNALESLLVERDDIPLGLNAPFEPPSDDLAQWISNCKSLRELSLIHVREAFGVLKQALPGIRLEKLVIQDYRSANDEDELIVWKAIGQQDRLRLFTIALQDSTPDGPALSYHTELANSICRLTNLTSLNLMQASVSSAEIERFSTCLPNLEELSFGGDLIVGSVIEHLSKLTMLTSLAINAVTAFAFENLQTFAQQLDPVTNRGIRVDILNQWFEAKLTEKQEAWLQDYFTSRLDGRFVITYPNDPDELHESDFSDSD